MEPVLVEQSTLLHLVRVERAFITNFVHCGLLHRQHELEIEEQKVHYINFLNELKDVNTSCIIYSKKNYSKGVSFIYAVSMRKPDAKQYFLMREPASEMDKPAAEQLFKTLDLVYDVKKEKNGFSFEDVTGKHRNHVAWDYELAEYTPENYKIAIECFAQYEACRFLNKFIKKTKQVIYLDKEEFGCAEDEPVNWIDAQMKQMNKYKSKL
jgi:hypothetical protein